MIIRELHQMVYLLNIRTLSMKLDQSDWRIISKVMLALVMESMGNKSLGGSSASFIPKVKQAIGELSEEDSTLWRLIM